MFRNRLEKNLKRLKNWAEVGQIEAYRLYDRDIPEFQFIVDRYKDHILVYEKTDPVRDAGKDLLPIVLEAITNLFPASKDKIVIKRRQRQEGLNQYEKIDGTDQRLEIRESRVKYWVNLHDYLDTGLFLDHRPLRLEFSKMKGQERTFLNLFSYTGTVSVAAAYAGFSTVSVDMSKTYITWAKDNFELNKLNFDGHDFIQADALDFLQNPPFDDKYDIIFLDPPTFSNSKRMQGNFEVERDQEILVTRAMKLLKPGGKLYFSNNKRKFRLSPQLASSFRIHDISERSIPMDFHDQKIHQCYEISNL